MNIYGSEYKKYLDLGLSVIPVEPRSKQTLIKGWQKFCDRLPTKEEAKFWAKQDKEYGIALCLGKASGLTMLDVDFIDPIICEYIKTIVPDPGIERFGSKGFARPYRFDGQATRKGTSPDDLELLGTGRYIVLPPSIHPDTNNPYMWNYGDLTDPKILQKARNTSLTANAFDDILEKVWDIFDQHEYVALKGGCNKKTTGRNNYLVAVVNSIMHRGVSTREEIIQELIKEDHDKHGNNALFEDPNEINGKSAYERASKFVDSNIKSFERLFGRSPTYSPPQIRINEESFKEKGVPDYPKPTGMLADMADYILSISRSPQLAFANAAAIVNMGTLICNKIRFNTCWPNLYVLLVGNSGVGKDTPLKAGKHFLGFDDINIHQLLGVSDYSSDVALLNITKSRRVRLDFIDEVQGFFKSVNEVRGSIHKQKIGDVLTSLWSSSSNFHPGRSTAEGGDEEPIYNPCVNLIAATTPTGFRTSLTQENMDKGFLGRFMFFRAEFPKKEFRIVENKPLPDDLRKSILYWANYKSVLDPQGNLAEINLPFEPINFHLSEKTDLMHDDIFNQFFKMKRDHAGSPIAPLVNRGMEMVEKMMLIHAASNFRNEIIEPDDLEWAYNTFMVMLKDAEYIFEENMSSGKRETEIKQLYAKIKKTGRRGITLSSLTASTRNLHAKTRNEYLEELLSLDEIIKREEPGKTKVTYRYFANK